MDTADEKCSLVAVPNGAYLVRCTAEVLLPFFSDESLPAVMASHDPPALPELRLVLLGRKGAGKSAAGNTILGGAERFQSGRPTEECVTIKADVAGRRVTVVDTPGWEWYYPLNSTPNWVRRETLRSVSLCPPGPHAVLLVVRARASVTDPYIREIEEHLEPLGGGVWEHAMLLFTRGDELGLASMEQRIATSGPALRRLLRKCGNRYHVLNNLRRADETQQVQELIRKLEQMMEERKEGNSPLEMDGSVLLGLEADRKRRARERRKKQRQMEAQMQRGTIKALMSDGPQGSELDAHHSFSKAPRCLLEVRLLLLGERETGKSSAGNTILGKSGFFQAGVVTEECVCRQAEVAAWLVTVVDTPGWEDGAAGATPERVRREIVSGVALCPPGPHALLLTLRVDTLVRAGHVREHLELLGEGAWRHTILLFTHGDQLREGVDIEQHVQGGGRDLRWLLEKCSGRYHVISSADGRGGGSTEVTDLLEKVEKMATMNRCEAFSSLVQDVRDLSLRWNEEFNQRLKEMGDKLHRKEAELRMEREMKSMRWFFDWKRKGKSPGKAGVQRDEEEGGGRRTDERTHDFGELKERMRWLTEDKEREVQDLSVENERIRAVLKQRGRERDEATFNLELKEREVEELRGRLDEQQAKLLHLERTGADNDREKRRWEDAIRAKEEAWRETLEESEEAHKREKAEWTGQIDSLKAEMDEIQQHCDDALSRKGREVTELEEELKREMETKLFERDKEQEELRKNAAEEKQFALDRATLQHQEMTRKIGQLEKTMETEKVKHREEIHQSLKEKAEDIERVRQQHKKEIRDVDAETRRAIENLRKHFAEQNEEHVKAKKQEMEELEEKYQNQIRERLRQNEKEKEEIEFNHKKATMQKMQEKEKEIEALKRQHQEEMNDMEKLMDGWKAEHQREVDRRVREKEEDVERAQLQYMKKIRDLEEERQRENEKCKEEFAKEERETEAMRRNVRELKTQLQQEKEKERDHLNYKKEIEQRLREKEKEMEEMKGNMNQMQEKMEEKERSDVKEMEARLKEKDREIEEVTEKLKELQQTEEERKRDQLNQRRQNMHKLKQNEQALEKLNENIEEMFLSKDEERVKILEQRLQDRGGHTEDMNQQLWSDMERKLKEKETELESIMQEAESREARWREEHEERENEVRNLRGIIERKTEEATKARSLLAERHRHVDEMVEKLREKEEALERLRRREGEHEEEIVQLRLTIEQTKSELKHLTDKMEEEMTSLIQEYEKEMARRDESLESMSKEKVEDVARVTEKCEELQEESEKMRKEAEDFKFKYEELKREREEEAREHEERESEIQSILNERDLEVRVLTEVKETLEAEIERLRNEAHLQMREDLERQMMERERELRAKDEEMEDKLLKREKEVEEREEFSQRRLRLAVKEEELEQGLQKLEANVVLQRQERDRYEREAELRTRAVERKEKEMASLLRALEAKQQELSSHGRDLQEKIKRLKDQGRELRDRERYLNNEERELLDWKAELQTQNEHAASTTQQLVEAGRDLARLKEELQKKEENLKTAFKKWSKWEVNLEAREAELHERDSEGGLEDSVFVVGKGREAKEDGGRAQERDCREGKERMRERGAEIGETGELPLRVVVLGESWSSRCPAGVTILGGEVSELDGSTLRSWRGHTAGRSLVVVEPLGLRWRDGPGQSNVKRSLLHGVPWRHQGAHVVLLLMPVFLTCTRKYRRAVEEDVGLLGEGIWQRALVVFTWGETLGVSAEQHILRNGELTGLVEKCGGRYHVLTSKRTKSETEGLFEKMQDVAALNSRGRCWD